MLRSKATSDSSGSEISTCPRAFDLRPTHEKTVLVQNLHHRGAILVQLLEALFIHLETSADVSRRLCNAVTASCRLEEKKCTENRGGKC